MESPSSQQSNSNPLPNQGHMEYVSVKLDPNNIRFDKQYSFVHLQPYISPPEWTTVFDKINEEILLPWRKAATLVHNTTRFIYGTCGIGAVFGGPAVVIEKIQIKKKKKKAIRKLNDYFASLNDRIYHRRNSEWKIIKVPVPFEKRNTWEIQFWFVRGGQTFSFLPYTSRKLSEME